MKKVLFFIYNGWVFGKIHNELIKALHPDVYFDILCWTGEYSQYEFELLKRKWKIISTFLFRHRDLKNTTHKLRIRELGLH